MININLTLNYKAREKRGFAIIVLKCGISQNVPK